MADQTESSISIDASASKIMAVIADFAAYPEWNEEVKQVEILTTEPGTGRPAQVRFVLDAGVIKDDYVLEYQWQGDREVRWRLLSGQMLTAMDGAYVLVDEGSARTNVSYRLAVDLRIPMIGLIKRKAEKVIIERALQGLQERVGG